jgi:hypothetical protein
LLFLRPSAVLSADGSLLFIVTVAQIANRKRSGNLRLSPCFTLRTMKRVASATTLVDTSIFTTTSTKRAQIIPASPVSSVSRLSESIASFRQVGFTGLLYLLRFEGAILRVAAVSVPNESRLLRERHTLGVQS